MESSLGARHVLDCTLRGDTQHIRLTARLTDIDTGETLWAERFDMPLIDLIAAQDELAVRVASIVQDRTLQSEVQRIIQTRTSSLSATPASLRAFVVPR